jgi:4-diphosphocytidyl-2-C-methyl-D-erythritol kinase
MNNLFDLHLDDFFLEEYAAELGSDCPFFIYNYPALAFGRGELLRPVKIDLSGLYLILVKPPVHISTPDAFRNVSFSEPLYEKSPELIIPVDSWNRELINSFESYVFNRNPEVKEIKNKLIKSGAIYASMSGSGSSVYGIFKKPVKLDFSDTDYFVFETAL